MFGLFGWNWKVRKLRKRWDRLREKALKKKNPMRSEVLERLDIIENNLRMLEERKLSRMERSRMAKEVEIDLEEVAAIVSMNEEEYLAEKNLTKPKASL